MNIFLSYAIVFHIHFATFAPAHCIKMIFMAANIFGRYVWLIDTLNRYKRLKFQEINELWQDSGLGNVR